MNFQEIPYKVVKGLEDEPLVVEFIHPIGNHKYSRRVIPERSYQVQTIVYWDETVTVKQQDMVQKAFDELFDAIGFDKSKLHFWGNWCEETYKDESGNLLPYKSVEWKLLNSWDSNKRQIDASRFHYNMIGDPYQWKNPSWEIIFTNKDLYTIDANYLIGFAIDDFFSVISLYRLEEIANPDLRIETQKTEIFHEVGHVLGLPTERRGNLNLEDSFGLHCKNTGCSMKQGLLVPKDWITNTQERLRLGGDPYCQECITDLKIKFYR